MFKRVLIAEDQESSNISIRKVMEDNGIGHCDYVYYCDDALSRIKTAIKNNSPYDLLITDLSFEEDGTPQQICDGIELIKAAKDLQPGIKVLVFSAENRPALVDKLFKKPAINAFVRKARRDVSDLKLALEAIKSNRQYMSMGLRQSIRENNTHEFTPYDITLISLLSGGTLQKDIPDYLRVNEIKPSGLSSVEKRLNHIKAALNFSKNEQLVAFCKDMGVI